MIRDRNERMDKLLTIAQTMYGMTADIKDLTDEQRKVLDQIL